ncbi:MAG: pstC, partial [Nitrosarchaeum sp.]|nr:pstC [Nitrosarchaeum sp.]
MLKREFGKSRGRGPLSDKIFKIAATVAGAYVLVVILLMVFQLGWGSGPIWHEEGIGF